VVTYAEGPEVAVDVWIDAAPGVVWALVSDISLPARFSSEARGAEWIEEGVRFRGHNHHDAIGDWTTECEVTALVPEREFAYAVGPASNPSASWRWTLEPEGSGTRLTQWMRIGPAPSGLSPAIEAMPDKEERIIERRLGEHRANMQANLDGIKGMAENR
jgi:hypothetical protein